MTCRRARCRWQICGGCGRARRLAPEGRGMCQHNRREPAVQAMVPCGGSGQQPGPGAPAVSAAAPALPSVPPISGSAQPSRPVRRGVAL
jgi:hypothetical protein